MKIAKFAALVLLVSSPWLITGVFGRQDLPAEAENAPLPSFTFVPQAVDLPKPWRDSEATPEALLALVEKSLQPEHVRWLDVRLFQEGVGTSGAYRWQGTLWYGPGERGRMEMNSCRRSASKLVVVSDGKSWRRESTSSEILVSLSLGKYSESPEDPGRRATFVQQGFANLASLLFEVRAYGKSWTRESGLWQDRPALRLRGNWTPTGDGPKQRADACRVILDGPTLWPHRVEWLGQDQVLLALEFRDPVVNQPVPEVEIAARVR